MKLQAEVNHMKGRMRVDRFVLRTVMQSRALTVNMMTYLGALSARIRLRRLFEHQSCKPVNNRRTLLSHPPTKNKPDKSRKWSLD